MTTFSLLPRWEFTVAAYVYDDDHDPSTDDGYSTMLYAKYMFYENEAKTGGLAVKVGTGLDPGDVDEADAVGQDAFRTLWTNAPMTIPLFDNKLSSDLMPGVSVTKEFGENMELAWGFTYSGRVAWNPWSPKWSIVGEVFGTEGQTTAIPSTRSACGGSRTGPRYGQ